jgi:2-oxoglutarate ferredoxin oxidoreductase subunit alpha
MSTNKLNWKIGGKAGYGIMTVGEMFSRIFVRGGYYIHAHVEYPSLIRGGHNTFQVRVDDQPVHAPIEPIDLLVALDKNTVDFYVNKIVPGGGIIYDADQIKVAETRDDIVWYHVPMNKLITDLKLPKVTENIMSMGASVAVLGYDLDMLNVVLEKQFGQKGPKVLEPNVTAALAGYNHIRDNYPEPFKIQLSPIEKADRMTITGNDAICMGAIKAGMKFIAIYPMTPTHTIMTYMAAQAVQYGISMVQPEDEISGINMAVGASFAGARSMVATSGGGFSLMTEGLGLAGMTENPLVIVEGQRPGPSTGLATRTAQGDLRFLLHASQGEFLRILVAPGDPEECFYETFNAFNLADQFQIPVFVLTDKHLATSYYWSDKFDTTGMAIDRGLMLKDDEIPQDFKRYQWTESGVSPRTIPGQAGGIFESNSDEHDETGYVSEQADVVSTLVDKRCRKYFAAAKVIDGIKLHGNVQSPIVLIGWGSTKGAILDAMSMLKARDGIDVEFLQVLYMSPFPTHRVKESLANKEKIVLIENNYGAQLGSLLKEHVHLRPHHKILKYDGRTFNADELYLRLTEVV